MLGLLDNDKLLDTRECAKAIGVSVCTMRNIAKGGYWKHGKFFTYDQPKFPKPVRLAGKLLKYRASEVQLWLNKSCR